MQINDLRLDIVNKELKHLYFLYGEEVGIRDIYIDKIKSILNLPIVYADSYNEIKNRLSTKSLFASNSIYVIIDDTNFEDVNIDPKDNYVIFIYSSIDKRSKVYKKFSDYFIEFTKLSPDEITKYIKQSGIKLSADNINDLIGRCNCDYAQIMLEIDKLKTYNSVKYGNDTSINKSYIEIKNDIFSKPKDAIFSLIDAILTKNYKKAMEYYNNCVNAGESAINIVYNLYNNVRQVIQVQSCVSKDVEKSTGLSPFIVGVTRNKCGFYKTESLIDILGKLKELDNMLKSSDVQDEYVIKYAILSIFSHI